MTSDSVCARPGIGRALLLGSASILALICAQAPARALAATQVIPPGPTPAAMEAMPAMAAPGFTQHVVRLGGFDFQGSPQGGTAINGATYGSRTVMVGNANGGGGLAGTPGNGGTGMPAGGSGAGGMNGINGATLNAINNVDILP